MISLKKSITQKTQFVYSIGCDPELFLLDQEGKYRSAHDLIPGSKVQPYRVEKGAVQPDGTSAEFNIDCALSPEEFSGNIVKVLKELREIVNSHENGLTLHVSPVATFDKKYFKTLPTEALAFGCQPDFDAWTGEQNIFKPTREPFRTGAGHVHIGWTNHEDLDDTAHLFDCQEATKQLDSSLYFCSLLWDKDTKRRSLYGKLGAFRPKPFGVEYRPLSNAWIADPDLHIWVFKAATRAMELLDSKDCKLWMDKEIHEMIQTVKSGLTLIPSELVDHHDRLVQEFDFPPLPKSYTQIAWRNPS